MIAGDGLLFVFYAHLVHNSDCLEHFQYGGDISQKQVEAADATSA